MKSTTPTTTTVLTTLLTTLLLLATTTFAHDTKVTHVPKTCTGAYHPGRDEVYYTVPYTYTQVLSIISSFKNLTWSGSPPNTVTLNGTNNTPGTSRTYTLSGLQVTETLLYYSAPLDNPYGPYQEVHNTATLDFPAGGAAGTVSVYIPWDETVVTSVCDGKASTMNFTTVFCSTEPAVAGKLMHMLHLGDAVNVGRFLGGRNFTDCEGLGSREDLGPKNQTARFPNARNATLGSGTATTTGAATGVLEGTAQTSGEIPAASSTAAESSAAHDGVRYQAGLVGSVVTLVAGALVL